MVAKAKKEADDHRRQRQERDRQQGQDHPGGDRQLEAQKLEAARKSTIEFIARVSAVYQAQAKALVELAKGENLVRPQAQAQQDRSARRLRSRHSPLRQEPAGKSGCAGRGCDPQI